jgi:hypothetical protein
MTDFNRVGGKVDAPTLAHILKYYGRFGSQADQVAAYERRKARQARGVQNLSHASHQQVTQLAQAGLIGRQPLPLTDYQGPDATADPTAGGPFGQGSGKVSPMVAATSGPGPGGSPTPGRPIAPPGMAGQAPQFTPVNLAGMLAAPSRPRKRYGNY